MYVALQCMTIYFPRPELQVRGRREGYSVWYFSQWLIFFLVTRNISKLPSFWFRLTRWVRERWLLTLQRRFQHTKQLLQSLILGLLSLKMINFARDQQNRFLSYLEFSNESQGKWCFVGSNCGLDHGDTEYLPLGPAASKATKVVAQGEHDLENLCAWHCVCVYVYIRECVC